MKKDYSNIQEWDYYTNDFSAEIRQLTDEGIDIEKYLPLFREVEKLENSEQKSKLCDTLFYIIKDLEVKNDYEFSEPSDAEGIAELTKPYPIKSKYPDAKTLYNKIYGAWYGRAIGCLLGKPLEGIRTDELTPLLKETANYPLHRYILQSDITDEICNKYKFNLKDKCFADITDGMPVDDDINYTVLYQILIDKYGKAFTSENIISLWTRTQSRYSYFTAERVAFDNYIKGFAPPETAVYKNPYREWIGAQIRADYFGYINPGKPKEAAEMAYRDARVSHIKNGIYGEMFIAAMIAAAAVFDNTEDIIRTGLGEIPTTSRLYKAVNDILLLHKNNKTAKDCYNFIHKTYDEHTGYGWCHTISNAMIVTMGLLYGNGDFGKSICLAVEAGFDTDCNGATVGSIIGMMNGIDKIDDCWKKPVNNKIHTSIYDAATLYITDLVEKTLKHI